MIQRQKHNKNVGQKEGPSPNELRRQTWQSIDPIESWAGMPLFMLSCSVA